MDYSFHKWWSMGFSKYHSYKLWVNKTLDFHSFSFWTPPEISFKFGLSQHFSYFLIKPVTTLDHLTRPKTLIKSYFTLFVSVQLLLLLNGVPKINWLTNLNRYCVQDISGEIYILLNLGSQLRTHKWNMNEMMGESWATFRIWPESLLENNRRIKLGKMPKY